MKINPGMNPPEGAPGASNPRKGREMETKMMGSNPAEKHGSGKPGASNPRKGTVVMPSTIGPGGIAGKIGGKGNPGSDNPRKGSFTKTSIFKG
jgi:hypothetical protein